MKNVEKIVIELIAEHLNLSPSEVGLDDRFGMEIQIDSVDAISLLLACEEKFGIEIPYHNIKDFLTPRHAVRYIEERL